MALTSASVTSSGLNRLCEDEVPSCNLSEARGRCFCCRASLVDEDTGAGLSSEHTIRMAALKFPSSIFAVTRDAKIALLSDLTFPGQTALHSEDRPADETAPDSNSQILFKITFERLRFVPPLRGFARMAPANESSLDHLAA